MQIALAENGLILDPYAFLPRGTQKTALVSFWTLLQRVLFGMKSKGNHWEASRPKYCFGSELQGGPPGVLVGICARLSGFLTFFRIIITSEWSCMFTNHIKGIPADKSWIGKEISVRIPK